MVRKKALWILFLMAVLVGCAGAPVREAMKENLSAPVGRIEGNQFTGIRYPFKVSAPPGWNMTTEFPDFLKDFGYEKSDPMDKEQTELYLFNPETKSSVQFDLTPADRYSVFSQEKIERLTGLGTESLKSELEKDYGKEIQLEVGPTTPVSLKGVQYGAKKYVAYTMKGLKREQGWIYAFSEPYQIFVLYMILEKEGANDHQALKTILDSFEFISKK